MYFCLGLISCFIYRNLNLWLTNYISNPDYRIRSISTYHSIGSTLSSYMFLNNIISYSLFTKFLFLNSFGYFILDSIFLLKYKNKNKVLLIEYLIHHNLCLYALGNLEQYTKLIAFCFLTEISTPFINFSWYLYKNGKTKSFVYYINFLTILFLFIKFRFFNFYWVYFSELNVNLKTNLSILTLWGLNSIWISSILINLRKEIINLLLNSGKNNICNK